MTTNVPAARPRTTTLVPTDIRRHIAMTAQTDPANFPRPEYSRYPLMILDDKGKSYKDAAGQAVIVYDAEEEEAFHAEHPEAPRVKDPEDMRSELERLRDENAKLKAQQGAAVDTPEGDEDDSRRPQTNKGVSGLVTKPKDAGKNKGPVGPAPGSKLDAD